MEKCRKYKDNCTERDANIHIINQSHSREPHNSHSRYEIKSLM